MIRLSFNSVGRPVSGAVSDTDFDTGIHSFFLASQSNSSLSIVHCPLLLRFIAYCAPSQDHRLVQPDKTLRIVRVERGLAVSLGLCHCQLLPRVKFRQPSRVVKERAARVDLIEFRLGVEVDAADDEAEAAGSVALRVVETQRAAPAAAED